MALQASSSPTYALPSPLPTGPRTDRELDLEAQGVSRHDLPAEADLLDAAEEDDLAPVLGQRQHGHRTRLRQRLELQDPGEHRVAGEVTPEHVLLAGQLLLGHRPLARLELEHPVEQEERVAVGKDGFDLRLVEHEVASPSRENTNDPASDHRVPGREWYVFSGKVEDLFKHGADTRQTQHCRGHASPGIGWTAPRA